MPLTKNELAEFKAILEGHRKETMRLIEGSKKDVTSADDTTSALSQHPADMGTDVAGQTVDLLLTNTEFNLLRMIEHALTRIEEGTYGICEDSGEEISIKRLRFLPWATRTAKAQETFDRQAKGNLQ